MKNKIIIFGLLLISIFGVSQNICFAAGPITGTPDSPISGTPPPTNPVTISDPLGSDATHPISIPVIIGRIINAALGIVGSLALLMFIFGGFTWMLAAGSQEKVKKGKDIIIWASIGLAVIFTSYTLVSFVINSITAKT